MRLSAGLRKKILQRDEYSCQVCMAGRPRKLEVHHILGHNVPEANDPENLITLCATCHDIVSLLVVNGYRITPERLQDLYNLAWEHPYMHEKAGGMGEPLPPDVSGYGRRPAATVEKLLQRVRRMRRRRRTNKKAASRRQEKEGKS